MLYLGKGKVYVLCLLWQIYFDCAQYLVNLGKPLSLSFITWWFVFWLRLGMGDKKREDHISSYHPGSLSGLQPTISNAEVVVALINSWSQSALGSWDKKQNRNVKYY